ncbi:MAG: metallophosphoesterase family protein [Lewinella sp.]|nr:metallophosphoesterase family protein [Lewinella sp.]
MRIPTIVFLLLTLAGNISAQDRDYYPPSAVPDRIILNLTDQPATSMAVTWRTAVYIGEGYVQVAEASPSPNLTDSMRVITAMKTAYLSDRSGAHYFSAVMDSLQPATLYAYRVGDKTHWSEWSQFETATEEPSPLSFIYFGDAQNDIKSLWSRTIRGAYRQMPKADFLLHAGDLINSRNRDHEWGEWYYAGGWINRMMPSVATPGNHEYGNDENGVYTLSKHWHPTFTLPANGPEGLEETVYYVDYQGTRVISLNSPAFLSSPEDSAAQVQWLTEVLEHDKQKWTVVTMHHPIYSTARGRDNENLRDGLQPLFEKYKVDLVLQGHDHTYGRGTNLPIGATKKDAIEGPIYVVSVSGPKMYTLGLDEWMQRGASNTQLYQIIHIDGDQLRYEAYSVDDQLYDAFELKKDADGDNLFYDLAPKNVEERLELPPNYLKRLSEAELEAYRSRFETYKARKALEEE